MPESNDSQRCRDDVRSFVAARVNKLQGLYFADAGRNAAAGQLAQLRRAASKAPGEDPNTWQLEFEELPETLRGKGLAASQGEWAVHIALTLYAVHMQSQKTGMHAAGVEHDIGTAVRAYVWQSGASNNMEDGRLPRRFASMVTADSIEEVAHYARQIVQLLRGYAIPLDYGRFARQLYDFQNPYRRDGVRLEWGRAYSRKPSLADDGPDDTATND